MLILVGSCAAVINGNPPGPTTPAAVDQASEEPSTDTEPDPEPEPSQETVQVGEKVRDGGYQFTVTDVRCGVKRVGSRYFGDKAQGQFCLVKLRVKNVSKKPIDYSEENQALVDTKGKTYSPDDEAWIHVDSDPYGEINPRRKRLCRSMFPSARSLTICC